MTTPETTAFDLLRRFMEKLDAILPKVDGIITLTTVRSGHQAYDGPNLVEELKEAKALLKGGRVSDGAPPWQAGSVLLTAEEARTLAFLLARAIREDAEASDADRREARKMLEKLGGDTQ